METEFRRDKYIYHGPSAEKCVEYFDIVMSHHYSGDMLYLAWDAAHKFGGKMTSDDMASFRYGVVMGARAEEAADFIDTMYGRCYAACEEYGRKSKMRSALYDICSIARTIYGVEIKQM